MKKFGVKDQISYMFGDIGGSFVNMYVDGFFLIFCTYVLQISPFFMGALFFIARLWDAVNDPIIGALPDKFLLGKSGDRFKPYVRLFMIPLAVSGILCFSNVSGFAYFWKHFWVCVAYVLFGMSYTGTSMPYGSLAGVISSDPLDRTKLSRARSIGGMFVAMVLAVVPLFIWSKNADGTQTPVPFVFFVFALIFGACSISAYLVMLKGANERVKYDSRKESYNYGRVIRGVLKNRPLIGAMIATIGSLISLTGITQFGTYMWKEYYSQPQFVSYVSIVTLPIMLIIFPFAPKAVKRFGKRMSVLAPCLLGLAVSLFLFIVPIPNPWIFFALGIIATFGNMVFSMLVWALVTDCLDHHEKLTGERTDGSVYSIFTFARKLGSTLASTLASFALGWIGYNAAVTTQTAEVAQHIRSLYASIPLISNILLVVGLGLVFNLKSFNDNKKEEN